MSHVIRSGPPDDNIVEWAGTELPGGLDRVIKEVLVTDVLYWERYVRVPAVKVVPNLNHAFVLKRLVLEVTRGACMVQCAPCVQMAGAA